MGQSFPENYKEIADSMGIALYQRFSIHEASLFLRCKDSDVVRLVETRELSFIKLHGVDKQFFGYQLLEYLLTKVVEAAPTTNAPTQSDRILKAPEVIEMTGLSRTTIWRMEKTGQFPARVSLGVGSVGWRESEVKIWLSSR